LASVIVVASAASMACLGCETHSCDSSGVNWAGGDFFAPGWWESTPLEAPWLDYPGQRTINFQFDAGCFPAVPSAEISAVPQPNTPNNNFTQAGGNLEEFSNLTFGGLSLTNGSCADYTVRVVVQCVPPYLGPFGILQDGGGGD
jgi:hypothetical protein